jgi:phage-related protein
MPLSRAMVSIAPGAAELRIRDRAGIYRVFHYVRSARGILVFHAFQKKGPYDSAAGSGEGNKTAEGATP